MEDNSIIERIDDLVKQSCKYGKPVHSQFLTPSQIAQINICSRLFKDADIYFDGGYDEALRKAAIVVPKGYEERYPGELKADIVVLQIRYPGKDILSNRDILGALMGLGIKRETLGDIIDRSSPQLLICSKNISRFIIQNLSKIGRSNVTIEIGEIGFVPEEKTEEITSTVASLRLDAVCSDGFRISRSKAAEAIEHDLVAINWIPVNSSSKEVHEGDTISLRGLGKIVLKEISGQSKKGRTFIKIHKYI